jgi:hypothetical protein
MLVHALPKVGGHCPRTGEDPDLCDLAAGVEREDLDELQHVGFYDLVQHGREARLPLDLEHGAELRVAITLGCCRENPLDDGLTRRLGGEDRGKQGDVIGERRDGRRVGPGRSWPFRRGGGEFWVCEVRVDLRKAFSNQCLGRR